MKDYAPAYERATSRRTIGREVFADLLPACMLIVGGMALGLTLGLGLRAVELERLPDESLARSGESQATADRWLAEGCTTDTDCLRMGEWVAVICANESAESCALVVDLLNPDPNAPEY